MPLPILMISYEAPPRLSAESILSAKTCKALFRAMPAIPVIDLVCASPGGEVPVDEKLEDILPETMRVHRVDPLVRGRKTILQRIIGGKGGWQQAVVTKSHALFPAEHKKPALIYSRSHPPASHLAALELVNGPLQGVPWVAHFSDPWSQHAYYRSPVTRAALGRYERLVLTAASRLIFVSEALREVMLAKAPDEIRAKARVIPHLFDPELYDVSSPPAAMQESRPVKLAHIGDLYGLRSPQPLFQALAGLLAEQTAAAEKLAVWLIGRFDPEFEALEERTAAEPLLRIIPPVTYFKSLAAMKTADVLLTIEAPVRQSVFFPSKLVDYLGAHKPLLAITPANSLTSRLMTAWGQPWFDVADKEGIQQCLRRVLAGDLWPAPPPEVLQQYAPANVGASLGTVLAEVLPNLDPTAEGGAGQQVQTEREQP